jgi:hypothetical protein
MASGLYCRPWISEEDMCFIVYVFMALPLPLQVKSSQVNRPLFVRVRIIPNIRSYDSCEGSYAGHDLHHFPLLALLCFGVKDEG